MADNKFDKLNGGEETKNKTSSYVDFLKTKLAEETAKKKGPATETSSDNIAENKDGKVSDGTQSDKNNKNQVGGISPSWKENIKNDNRSNKGKQKQKEEKTKKEGSVVKRLGVISLSVLLAVIVIIGGYFAFLQISFNRIEDSKYIQVSSNQSNRVVMGAEYSISTFNIGFGAYSQSFSFFMDEGETMGGVKTKGKNARAYSEEDVYNNMNGIVNLVKTKANSDFYFFQEVDTDSTRSHYVNQRKIIEDAFVGYSGSYAVNSHSKFLFYPLSEPIGTINSGILTLSKYNVDYSIRRSLKISTGLIDRLFDLDRCFMVTKIPVSGTNKYLVLVNVHLSAYDDGDVRKEQIAMLYDYMDYEYNKNGNYVVVGGDFNLLLAGEAGLYNNNMKTPEWCQSLPEGYTAENFASIGFAINYDLSTTIGTCRDSSVKYTEGLNLEVVIDGFMTSGNVVVKKTETIDGEFKNSDHNPVQMKFVLG